MARLKPGEGYGQRRERRKRSRHRQKRKCNMLALKGEGAGRAYLTAALLDAGKLPLGRDLKALRRADFTA